MPQADDMREAVGEQVMSLTAKVGESVTMGRPSDAVEYAEALRSTCEGFAALAWADGDA